MSNCILQVTGLISALLIASCAAMFAQDAPPFPANEIRLGCNWMLP
jgi:hypothetical protein